MFFQASLKDKRFPTGLYAEYCPLQREIRLFHLFEVRKTLSVFFLPIGSERVAHELKDVDTGVLHLLPKKPWLHGVAEYPDSAESLAAYSNPGAIERYEAGMARDVEAMDPNAPTEVRVLAMVERLAAAEHWLRQATVRGGSESLIALQMAGFLFAAIAAAILWSVSLAWFVGVAILAALFLVGAVWSIVTQQSRAGRKVVLDVMRRSVAPLHPTLAEATAALELARRNKLRIARALRAVDLAMDTDPG
ncbi:MAG: hypothetical protein ACF8QF_00080 [Phycisphaerales bacterium]